MALSDDRIRHLSHVVVDELNKQKLCSFADSEKALNAIQQEIRRYQQLEEEIDDKARTKIQSLSRNVPEGSPEWDVLHRKYSQEERNRLKW